MTRHYRLAVAMAAAVLLSTGAWSAHAKQPVEVAFVLDTTGSMGPLIEGAKKKIWSIATSIFDANPNADVRLGLVAYRDIGDDYVTKRFDLTTDIQDLYAKLLELRAEGGGDRPESVNEALDVAVTGEGDLVADYTSGRQKLDALRDDELPPAIRALPKPERGAAVEQQATQRKELNAKLAELVAKRDAYIAEQRGKQQPKATDSFDQAVAATLKAQIK